MTDMILCYITCESEKQAKEISKHLIENKLCACVNIFSNMQSMLFWPPKSGKLIETNEFVIIAKTIESKYKDLESEVKKIHSYEIPCIFSIPVTNVDQNYFNWLINELKND
ncbi:MAG: divalent-cation tolerance protein CutA [Candidatus Shapirobacteria bacterium]